MKKKFLWLIGVLVIVASSCCGYVLYSYFCFEVSGGDGSPPQVTFNQTVADDGWYLTVNWINDGGVSGERVWRQSNVIYNLVCKELPTFRENGTLESIKNDPSGYNITWLDKDSNNKLSLGDVIFISNTGGLNGEVEGGDIFKFRIIVENKSITEVSVK